MAAVLAAMPAQALMEDAAEGVKDAERKRGDAPVEGGDGHGLEPPVGATMGFAHIARSDWETLA